jgi:hypothetical protein
MGLRDKRLHAPFQITAWQEDAPTADPTFDADVGAEAHDRPFKRTARMRLAQAHDIVEKQLEGFSGHSRKPPLDRAATTSLPALLG